jgi:hypothetical protein
MCKLPTVFQMDDENNEFLFKEKCKAKEDEELSLNFTSKWTMESMCKKNPLLPFQCNPHGQI